jgi:hypothetical protein
VFFTFHFCGCTADADCSTTCNTTTHLCN